MTDDEARLIAVDAQIDQNRALASQRLNDHIEAWRETVRIDGGSDTGAFSGTVASAMKWIDPNDELPDEQSNRLVHVAEVLAVALSRIAKADA